MAAIGLSIACLAHCLALPVAAAFLPVLGVGSEAAWAHWAFVAVAAPLSIWTLAGPPRGALQPNGPHTNLKRRSPWAAPFC